MNDYISDFRNEYPHLLNFEGTLNSLFSNEILPESNSIEMELNVTPLFVSGFGFSGSSAIADFLKSLNCDDIQTFSNFEFRLLWCLGEARSLGDWLLAEDVTNLLTSDNLCRLVLGALLGVNVNILPKQYSGKILKDSVINHFDKRDYKKLDLIFSGFVSKVRNLISDNGSQSCSKVRFLCWGLYNNLLKLKHNGVSRYMLIDNGLLARDIKVLSVVDNFKCVAVIRDPRDIYIERVRLKNWKGSHYKFINQYKEYLSSYIEGVSSSVFNLDNHKLIRFENFIMSDSERSALVSWLFLEKCSIHKACLGVFNAIDSMVNINIWCDTLTENEKSSFSEVFTNMQVTKNYYG